MTALAAREKWIFRALFLGLLGWLAIYILKHPLATNDGPVHVAFSHAILTHNRPDQPLQSAAYTVKLRPNPNLGVYLLMAALMRVLSPSLTESIIQMLCILGPPVAGYFAIRMIKQENAWLSILFIPLVLNQMLFLGLYNHSISLAAFLLVIGTYFWMSKSPSYPRALALSGSLLLTFLCHASGFLIAFTSLAAMAATIAVRTFLRERNILSALKSQRFALLAILAPLPLAAVFLASGGKSETLYLFPLWKRIWQFGKLSLLTANYPLSDRFPAFLFAAFLLVTFSLLAVKILNRRLDLPEGRREQALAAMAATLAAIAVMLAFPDVMGGGWTHFRRFVVFPYFWMILVLAFGSFSVRAFALFTAVGASVSLWLITSTVARQNIIRLQMQPFLQADALIGAHCTVLPLPLQGNPPDERSGRGLMSYLPFYQAASRLELRDDRLVLFNFLARLPPYPVHFLPAVEPQEHIFGWAPQQISNQIERIDLPGFEAESGMLVDYILIVGDLNQRSEDMRAQVQKAIIGFGLIYRSPDQSLTLYRRLGSHSPACTMRPHDAE